MRLVCIHRFCFLIMDFEPLVERKRARFEELEREISSSGLFDNATRAREVLREHSATKDLLDLWGRLVKARREYEENRELASSDDKEMADLAAAEIPALESLIPELERAVQVSLLPPEPDEDRDAIVEIRAGTGGTEAALFAADLFRMYSRYADSLGLKVEEMDSSAADLGGFREMVFRVSGTSVFRRFRYESGVHRVQRVPATEAQGRIHTSAAGVLILAEADEVDVEIRQQDLRIDVYRSSGPGGQSVNTTDSAVRITHIPTGIVVSCQNEKSQLQKKESALRILRARMLAAAQEEADLIASVERNAQVRSVDRSERIRTYNFPENRLSDHRVNFKANNLDAVLNGELDDVIAALLEADKATKLASGDH